MKRMYMLEVCFVGQDCSRVGRQECTLGPDCFHKPLRLGFGKVAGLNWENARISKLILNKSAMPSSLGGNIVSIINDGPLGLGDFPFLDTTARMLSSAAIIHATVGGLVD